MSKDRKREAGDEDGDVPNKLTKTSVEPTSSFERGTTEGSWGPEDVENKYVIRYVHGETCCESPWSNEEDWPTLTYVRPAEDDEDEYQYILSVIAGLWIKETGEFVAFWGADEGDGHIDFYCKESFENPDELEPLSGILSTEICPPLIDCFDDGSGKDRDPLVVPDSVFSHELLDNLYLRA